MESVFYGKTLAVHKRGDFTRDGLTGLPVTMKISEAILRMGWTGSYRMAYPPSTRTVVPVTKSEARDAR